jgi:hypothetical protein
MNTHNANPLTTFPSRILVRTPTIPIVHSLRTEHYIRSQGGHYGKAGFERVHDKVMTDSWRHCDRL